MLEPRPAAIDHEREAEPPSFVAEVLGEVAPDGRAIGLRIQRSARGPVDLCLRCEDLQYFISLILALGHEAKRVRPASSDDAIPEAAIPLPITALSVGPTVEDKRFLILDVGVVSLTFSVPSASLKEVAQTLLALSARGGVQPS